MKNSCQQLPTYKAAKPTNAFCWGTSVCSVHNMYKGRQKRRLRIPHAGAGDAIEDADASPRHSKFNRGKSPDHLSQYSLSLR
ncbi:hypothetical protein BaRGS_00017650 [Batillaria attramentaria]|uniref:Uncharacterized protein n=1 Tax=Batillaria attramentaria TaxID=370345 RepID=A0ABD0KVJ1_9CAEN